MKIQDLVHSREIVIKGGIYSLNRHDVKENSKRVCLRSAALSHPLSQGSGLDKMLDEHADRNEIEESESLSRLS